MSYPISFNETLALGLSLSDVFSFSLEKRNRLAAFRLRFSARSNANLVATHSFTVTPDWLVSRCPGIRTGSRIRPAETNVSYCLSEIHFTRSFFRPYWFVITTCMASILVHIIYPPLSYNAQICRLLHDKREKMSFNLSAKLLQLFDTYKLEADICAILLYVL